MPFSSLGLDFQRSPSPIPRRPTAHKKQPNLQKLQTLRSLANTNCCSRRYNRISALVCVANYQPTGSLGEVEDDFSALLGAVIDESVKFDSRRRSYCYVCLIQENKPRFTIDTCSNTFVLIDSVTLSHGSDASRW